jgi:hypothetical protein
MRSWSIVACTILVAAPAVAQPVTSPSACSVDLVRAPDDVRAVIDAWLAHARHCSLALEVRVVPTEHGLYVVATDDRGTLRDRVVPDAQTAGALIASWADDGQPAPVATIDVHAEVDLTPFTATGGPTPIATNVDAMATQPRSSPHHWVGEYVLFGGGSTAFHGLRGEVDVLRGEAWTAGVAFTIAQDKQQASSDTMTETLTLSDLGATLYLAHAMRVGGWELRPAIGAGVTYTRAFDFTQPVSLTDARDFNRVSPIAEVSLLGSHALVGNLGVSIGALVIAYGQQLDAQLPDLQRRDIAALFVGGLRFGFL